MLFLVVSCAAQPPDQVTDNNSIIRAPSDYCKHNPDTPICDKKVLDKSQ